MVQSKDASFKYISKEHLMELFDILNVEFGVDLDFSNVEVLTSEEVIIKPSLIRPDYIVKIGNTIFMIEFESSYVGRKKKKLFKLYVAAFDYKNNEEDNEIIFFVVSTKEKSKMANYRLNDWDNFNFPIVSLKDLDKEKIINNIEMKIKDNDDFTNRDLLELALTPILEENHDKIVNQFYETKDLIGEIDFPNIEIKESVYGLVLMLSSMFFDELDPLRKELQGELMAKVDCVQEACRNSFIEGESKGIAKGIAEGIAEGKSIVAKRMLDEGVDLELISKCTGLSMVGISKLLDNLNE